MAAALMGWQGVLILAGCFRALERLLCGRFPGDPPENGDRGRFQADSGNVRLGCDQSGSGVGSPGPPPISHSDQIPAILNPGFHAG